MRQIKFRAWDGYRMYSPAIVDGIDWHLLEDREIKGYPLMQYTGLKDKNGNDIYEDDILRINDKQMQVVFRNGCFYTSTSTSNYRLGGWALEAVEIIGNIHEHPDLIPVPPTQGNG